MIRQDIGDPRGEELILQGGMLPTHAISCHHPEQLSIEDLVRYTGYTATYLARKFRKHLGLSSSAYLLRLQHACTLLQSTNLPITSIAREVGFRDSQHFAKRFRQAIATTPSAFRARTRAGMQPKGTEIDKRMTGGR